MDPVPGDYDGDGLWDLGLYERRTAKWYVRNLGSGPAIVFGLTWGSSAAEPVGVRK
jgi:hypothetical protein